MNSVSSFGLAAYLLLMPGIAFSEATPDRVDMDWIVAKLKEGVSADVLIKRLQGLENVELDTDPESLIRLNREVKKSGVGDREREALLEAVIDLEEKRDGLKKRDEFLALLANIEHRHLVRMGEKAYQEVVSLLTQILGDTFGPQSRYAAAQALGRLKPDAKAINALLDAVLDDEDAQLRVVAAEALGKIGEPKTVSYIFRGFQRHRDKPGSIELLKQLKYFKTLKAMDFLIPLTEDDKSGVRKAARETLQLLTGSDADSQEGWREILRDLPHPMDWERSPKI